MGREENQNGGHEVNSIVSTNVKLSSLRKHDERQFMA